MEKCIMCGNTNHPFIEIRPTDKKEGINELDDTSHTHLTVCPYCSCQIMGRGVHIKNPYLTCHSGFSLPVMGRPSLLGKQSG